jgi:hypothetical protein
MDNKIFPDFNLSASMESGDYIVGYKSDGTVEFSMTLYELVEYLKNYFISNVNP